MGVIALVEAEILVIGVSVTGVAVGVAMVSSD